MGTVQQWHDDNDYFGPNAINPIGREMVAEFVDAPIPHIGEHVYTHNPEHEWLVKMVRYNMVQREDGNMLVSVQLERLW